jgi:hypothetical protein
MSAHIKNMSTSCPENRLVLLCSSITASGTTWTKQNFNDDHDVLHRGFYILKFEASESEI